MEKRRAKKTVITDLEALVPKDHLLREIETVLRERGCTAIHLSVAKCNVPAYKTYIKAGFETIGEAEMYGGDYYLMEKELKIRIALEKWTKKQNDFIRFAILLTGNLCREDTDITQRKVRSGSSQCLRCGQPLLAAGGPAGKTRFICADRISERNGEEAIWSLIIKKSTRSFTCQRTSRPS